MGAPQEVAAPRLVLDTNIVVSALIFLKGRLTWLRPLWRGGAIVPLVSTQTAQELLRVLAYPKFKLSPEEREELLADYLPFCETVTISNPPPTAPKCRDPADAPFLQLALAGKADALITGDADLLALSTTFSIPILCPEELREHLGRSASS